MKFFCLSAFLSLAVVITGCGTTHSMVKGGASSHVKGLRMQDFLALGHVSQTDKGIELTVGADDLFHKKAAV
jgi:hypothetical protein